MIHLFNIYSALFTSDGRENATLQKLSRTAFQQLNFNSSIKMEGDDVDYLALTMLNISGTYERQTIKDSNLYDRRTWWYRYKY